ncbi:TldD/PmbA family protein [Trinickia dinghuensis]|nr:metallopeptidase TldD-related protein [Trinickia dinghuensis]
MQLRTVVSELGDTAALALELARAAGAEGARVEVAHSESRTAMVRNRVPSERSFRLASEISITVYRDGKRASTSSSDLSREGLENAVRAALDITNVTAADSAAGLADPLQLANVFPDLDLYHPFEATLDDMMSYAQRTEAAAFEHDSSIRTSNGASVQTVSGVSLLATSVGFSASAPWSVHSLSCAPVAAGANEKQIGFWSHSARAFDDLAKAEEVGGVAAKRAMDALDARQIPTQQCAVLFEPTAALGLLGELVSAASGDALYRTGSFLKDRLGASLFPEHIHVSEDPFLKRGMGSRCFDSDGIPGSRRMLVQDGRLQGYFLGLYAARRLGLQPTGNGYGPHNLEVRSTRTSDEDDFGRMLGKLNRGLVVTEMVGGGVNRLTGDFSRAAKGFWVENGAIQFPVTGVTLASNLMEMFGGLQAIGSDAITRGASTSGSWLIEAMKVGGA